MFVCIIYVIYINKSSKGFIFYANDRNYVNEYPQGLSSGVLKGYVVFAWRNIGTGNNGVLFQDEALMLCIYMGFPQNA